MFRKFSKMLCRRHGTEVRKDARRLGKLEWKVVRRPQKVFLKLCKVVRVEDDTDTRKVGGKRKNKDRKVGTETRKRVKR